MRTKPERIAAMHREYGRSGEGRCKDCCNYQNYEYRGREYRKCDAYGDTRSEATDWNAGFEACGMLNEPFGTDKHRPMIEVLRRGSRDRKAEAGEEQVRLF